MKLLTSKTLQAGGRFGPARTAPLQTAGKHFPAHSFWLESLSDACLDPWLEAACHFELNSDFDVAAEVAEEEQTLELSELMGIMKAQSEGKRTIQALGDKILLHRLVSNLGVAQMPMLLGTHGSVDASEVERLVENLECSSEDAFEIVAKPTHLSNSSGTLVLSKAMWRSKGYNAEKLTEHLEMYMEEQAHETESAALQSLVPGFVVQPRYRSCIDFGAPIEVRVVTLWGKTRLGIWWWGSKEQSTKWELNTWVVPVVKQGQQGKPESWTVLHDNPGGNDSYQAALELILQAMGTMARAAERIARATGAPFLRSDFFVGSPKWGVRLNEVAYGSNIMLRRIAKNPQGYADDAPAIAHILHEGFKHCHKRMPPEHFLDKLGAQGKTYEPAWWKFWGSRAPGLQVSELPESIRIDFAPSATSPSDNSPSPAATQRRLESNLALAQGLVPPSSPQVSSRPPWRINPPTRSAMSSVMPGSAPAQSASHRQLHANASSSAPVPQPADTDAAGVLAEEFADEHDAQRNLPFSATLEAARRGVRAWAFAPQLAADELAEESAEASEAPLDAGREGGSVWEALAPQPADIAAEAMSEELFTEAEELPEAADAERALIFSSPLEAARLFVQKMADTSLWERPTPAEAQADGPSPLVLGIPSPVAPRPFCPLEALARATAMRHPSPLPSGPAGRPLGSALGSTTLVHGDSSAARPRATPPLSRLPSMSDFDVMCGSPMPLMSPPVPLQHQAFARMTPQSSFTSFADSYGGTGPAMPPFASPVRSPIGPGMPPAFVPSVNWVPQKMGGGTFAPAR